MQQKLLLLISILALELFSLGHMVHADNSMAGMDMGGAKAAPAAKPSALLVTATVNPAAPQTGDNTLNLLVTGPDGKPVTGLKLTTTVAMTTMDMGTTHPAVTETGGGHYTAKVGFGMDGPWRVIVANQGVKIAVLDFNAGSKTPWKSPQTSAPAPQTSAPAPSAKPTVVTPAATAQSAMPGMDMGSAAAPETGTPDTGAGDAAPMKMTGIADMKTATIPQLQETGTYTATGNEDWKAQTGFGHNAPMVAMMNSMMIGGSGGEGMKMAPMTMKFGKANYANPDAGDSMAGMDMSGKSSGAKGNASAPAVTAAINAPKTGDNILQITVTDAGGKPITGAEIATTVTMTSMDMGTTHPAVTEKGSGRYASTVTFGMAGPWRVQVRVTPPGQTPQTKDFDFTAK